MSDQQLTELSPDLDAVVIARAIRKAHQARKKATPATLEIASMIANIHITDTMEGSSTLEVELADSNYALVDAGFFDSDKNGRLDPIDLNYPEGSKMWWRCSQMSIARHTITLTFMERPAMLLMSHTPQNSKKTPIKSSRQGQTRAQFIKRLVQSVKAYGGIQFISKDLNVKQEIGDEGSTTSAVTGDIWSVGDSLAVGMEGPLSDRYKSNALGGRNTAQHLAVLSGMTAAQRKYVVLSTGTNDGSLAAFTTNFDSILALSGIQRIWIFTISGNPNAGLDASINAAIDSRASSNSKLRVIDWRAEVTSGRVSLSDGIHPGPAGYDRRAQMTMTAVGNVSRPSDDQSKRDAAKNVEEEAKDAGLSVTQIKDLKIGGKQMTPEQQRNVDRVLSLAANADAGPRPKKALVEACLQESGFQNGESVRYKDHDSRGVLQVRDSTGKGMSPPVDGEDIDACVAAFLNKGFASASEGIGAIGLARKYPTWTPGQIAQACQGSAYPDRYDKRAEEADAILEAGGGGSDGSTTNTYRRQYNFQVGSQTNPTENFWDAMLRLGIEEVNWALFLDRNRIFFDPENTLIKQKVADSWHREDPETLDWDFVWDVRKIATEMTIERICDPFEFRAGEVIKVNGFGPASTGSMARPDPLPGRWLIAQIDRDRYDFHSRFTLKQPEPTLVEPLTDLVSKTADEASDASMADITKDMTPKDVIDQIVIPMAQALDLTDSAGAPITPLGVERANGIHDQKTTTGNTSQHKGPPEKAWAADISEGGSKVPTEKTKKLARQLKERFDISGDFPWGPTLGNGRGEDKYFRYQLIHGVTGTANGGDHMTHVHFGVGKK